MDILLISYGDYEFDGRLRSLIQLFSQIGDVHSITRGKTPPNDMSKVTDATYRKFISESIQFARKQNKIDWLVLDNRKATIPGLIIKRQFKPTTTILDCRELYLFRETKHFSGKVGCVFERFMSKKADIVICANQERAQIMQKEYGLLKKPLTYENLRKLEYKSEEDLRKAKEKIDPILHDGEYRIISTSGCSLLRTNDVLVRNISRVKNKCRVYLVGESTTDEVNSIKKIIEDHNLDNVEIIGRLNQTELKYLISECHIGIVNYGQYDTNNRLCASGKIYEFLYEGIPVVTTSNPPLYKFCKDEQIGCADDTYYLGIDEIIDHYNDYKKNVEEYTKTHSPSENNERIITGIMKSVNETREE